MRSAHALLGAVGGVEASNLESKARRKPRGEGGVVCLARINVVSRRALALIRPAIRRDSLSRKCGGGQSPPSINPLWYKGGVQGIIPCAGVGFRIGHAETHGPDAFRVGLTLSRHRDGSNIAAPIGAETTRFIWHVAR